MPIAGLTRQEYRVILTGGLDRLALLEEVGRKIDAIDDTIAGLQADRAELVAEAMERQREIDAYAAEMVKGLIYPDTMTAETGAVAVSGGAATFGIV